MIRMLSFAALALLMACPVTSMAHGRDHEKHVRKRRRRRPNLTRRRRRVPPPRRRRRQARRLNSTSSSRSESSSSSSSSSNTGFLWGGEFFLVQDKIMAGLRLGGQGETIGGEFEFAPIYTTRDFADDGLDGRFAGVLMGGHLTFKVVDFGGPTLHVGTGIDYFGMWGIYSDEYHLGLPALVEARLPIGGGYMVSLQARAELLHSEGLEVGVDREGNETMPFLFSVAIGGVK